MGNIDISSLYQFDEDQFQYLKLKATVTKKEIKHSPSNESGESVSLKGMLMNGLTWKFFPKLGV